MLHLNKIHHVAVICSDYVRSKYFYTQVLGLVILAEHYRAERGSYKLDLALNGTYIIELFSFPDSPPRLTRPEATGLRHIAFEVDDLEAAVAFVEQEGIAAEAIRVDDATGKRFIFFADPDGLPIELYESN